MTRLLMSLAARVSAGAASGACCPCYCPSEHGDSPVDVSGGEGLCWEPVGRAVRVTVRVSTVTRLLMSLAARVSAGSQWGVLSVLLSE